VTSLEIILLVSLVLALGLLVVSFYFNYKHGVLIIKVIESIEDSLDILDNKYSSVSEILEIPLFYDSPQIQQVVADLADSRDAILKVANLVGTVEEVKVGEE
jgi:hypothetical protein